MNWERITSPEFEKAAAPCGRVCLLSFGVIEKHGSHLPLGQDALYIHEVCTRAADAETAMVFPMYYFGQIHEARHVPGTVAIAGKLLMPLLENVCDEIARNGFDRIVVVNGHGGNNSLISYFLQLTLERRKEYIVFSSRAPSRADELQGVLEAETDGHAGEEETSAMLHLHPELVKLDAFESYGATLGRILPFREAGLDTGIWWYADYPGHLAAEEVPFTPEKGRLLVESHVAHLIQQIRLIKDDPTPTELLREFYDRSANPENRYP